MLKGLVTLIRRMDGLTGPADMAEIEELLRNADVEREELVQACKFSDVTYARNLLSKSRWYELLIICWRHGQCSPIHDHEGSSCGVRIVDGTATETRYEEFGAGAVELVDTREFEKGGVCMVEDTDIHVLHNLQPGKDLVSLHLYSPPLNMTYYELAADSQS